MNVRLAAGLSVLVAGLLFGAACSDGQLQAIGTSEQICHPKIASGTAASGSVSERSQPVAAFEHAHPEWVGGRIGSTTRRPIWWSCSSPVLTPAGQRLLEARYPTIRFVAGGPFVGVGGSSSGG